MPYTKLTQEIKKRVEKLPFVDAFYIHGSRGVNRHSSTSDIDYMFLLKNKKRDEPKLRRALKGLIVFRKVNGWFPEQIWEVCKWKENPKSFHDVGLHTITTREMLSIASKLFLNKSYFLKHQDFAQFFVIEAKEVYDPLGYVKKLKSLVSKYPDKLSKEILKEMVKNLKIKLNWVGDKWISRNKYSFVNDIRDIIWFIAVAHYAKNKAFLMNSMKRWHQDMKSFRPNIKKDIDKLISIDSKFSNQNKTIYLKRIIKKLEG